MSVKKVLLSIVDLPQVELAAVWIDVRIEFDHADLLERLLARVLAAFLADAERLPWDAQPLRRRLCHLFYRIFYSRSYRGPRRTYCRRRATCSQKPRRDIQTLLWIRRELRS